jgi:hypothetical protein
MTTYVAVCDGTITNASGNIATCSNGWQYIPFDFVNFVQSNSGQITASDILLDLTWGAGVVLTLWSVGYAIGAAKFAVGKL